MLDPEIAAHVGPPMPMPELTPELVGMLRVGMTEIGKALPGAEIAAVTEHLAGDVPMRLYRPDLGSTCPLIVFLHGGGWMLGDLDSHDAMMRHLAQRSGSAVLSVGYRLAPEHPFPAGLDDAATALAWARLHAESLGCDPAAMAFSSFCCKPATICCLLVSSASALAKALDASRSSPSSTLGLSAGYQAASGRSTERCGTLGTPNTAGTPGCIRCFSSG